MKIKWKDNENKKKRQFKWNENTTKRLQIPILTRDWSKLNPGAGCRTIGGGQAALNSGAEVERFKFSFFGFEETKYFCTILTT